MYGWLACTLREGHRGQHHLAVRTEDLGVPWPSQPKRLAEDPARIFLRPRPYYDNPGWADVPDHHLVDVADGVVTVIELEA
jgi:hypothetical protein